MASSHTSDIPKIAGLKLLRYALPLIRKPFQTLRNLTAQHGGLIEFNGGKYQQLFLVSDAESVRHILKTNKNNYKRSPVIKALRPFLGNGIFISEDDVWKSQHNLMKPAFHESLIRTYEQVIESETNWLTAGWRSSSSPINIEPQVEKLMLAILLKTQFTDALDYDYEQILQAQGDVLEQTSIKTQKLGFFKNKLKALVGLSTSKSTDNSSIEYLRSVAREIITFGREHPDRCGFLFRNFIENNASDDDLRDLILNMIFAGYDTTASALSWTLYALAANPEIQQMARDEVAKTDISFATTSSLSYVRQVVQESMRLYPPVWALLRQCESADSFNGMHFEPGSYFMICSYTMHRDPKHWEHPNTFYPDHFLPENIRGKAFQYIPFGQGERICIGKPLAMTELVYMTATLLKRFAFSYTETQEPRMVPGIITKSEKGIYLRIKPL